MHIGFNLQILDTHLSGVEYYGLGIINALVQLQTNDTYVVFTNNAELIKHHLLPNVRLTIKPINGMKNRLQRIIWEHTRLPGLARRENLDVLYCPSYICPAINFGVPYVVTIHDTIALDHPTWCKCSNAVYYNLSMRMTASRAARIVTVSENSSASVARHFPASSKKIRTIPPGLDAIFRASVDVRHQSFVRRSYGLPRNYILYVGNLEPKKNIPTILKAFHLLKQRGCDHSLVLVGKKQWGITSQLSKLMQNPWSEDIYFPGYVDRCDLPAVYQMADVFVFPSLYEGFGFPPLEAMACGVPVIASQQGALADTLNDAVYAISEYKDPKVLAGMMHEMLADSELRKKYSRLGQTQAANFGWDKSAASLTDVFCEVAGKK